MTAVNPVKMRHQRDRAIGYQHHPQRWMLGVARGSGAYTTGWVSNLTDVEAHRHKLYPNLLPRSTCSPWVIP